MALVLVASFSLVMATPAEAAFGTYAGYTFGVPVGSGTIAWSNVEAHSNTYSVLINAPVAGDYARVKIPVTSSSLATFPAPSLWYKIDAGASATAADIGATWPMYIKNADALFAGGFLSPFPMLEISNDGGATSKTLIGQTWASSTKVGWTQW